MPGSGIGRDEYFRRWSEAHGGYDPRESRLTSGWLTGVHLVARPFAAARVPPDLITILGIAIALLAVVLASMGGRWLLAAAAVVVLSGLADNLDGAVAVMTDRVSAWGYVLDSVVDRVGDALFLLALYVAGAPAWACVTAGMLTMLQEYARARAGAAGMSEIGVVTLWERPTRIVVTAMFLVGGGLYTDSSGSWAAWASYAWLGLAVVGLVQVMVMLRSRLTPGR